MFRMVLYFQVSERASPSEYKQLHDILEANDMDIVALLDQITPTCKDMLERCMWKSTQTRCDTLFERINTTEGVCCSFNYHGIEKSNFPALDMNL